MCLEGSYWTNLFGATPKEICSNLLRRPPAVTIVYFALCVFFYYFGEREWNDNNAFVPARYPDPPELADWYKPLSSMFMHLSETHLWSNVIMLFICGVLLEVTEGSLHVAHVVIGSGVLGAGFHGVFSDARVRGASGAIYGVLWSQISLLALNWREMPGRWLRLLSALVLFGIELFIYHTQHDERVSYQSHIFGALAGVFICLVSGRNVVFLNFELGFNLLGVLGYAGLVTTVAIFGELWCAAWAALVLPMLLFDTWRHLRRAQRGEVSQKVKEARERRQRLEQQRPPLPKERPIVLFGSRAADGRRAPREVRAQRVRVANARRPVRTAIAPMEPPLPPPDALLAPPGVFYTQSAAAIMAALPPDRRVDVTVNF